MHEGPGARSGAGTEAARGAEGAVIAQVIERGIRSASPERSGARDGALGSSRTTPASAARSFSLALSTPGAPKGTACGSDGDAVVVAITRWPESHDETPEGRIETVLGRPGELSVEVAKILVLEGVGEPHSDVAICRVGGLRRRGPPRR